MNLYVDVDDVLAETTRAIADHAREHFDRDVEFEQMHSFRLDESLGLDPATYEALMESIHRAEFLGGLRPMQGAVDVLTALTAVGTKIAVVTGRPPSAREVTRSWLEAHRMPFHEICMVDKYGRNPNAGAMTLEQLRERPFDVAIEDSLGTALFLAEHTTVEVLLMDRPWNRAAPNPPKRMRRVHGWDEIRSILGD